MIAKRLFLLLSALPLVLSTGACKDTTGSNPEVRPRAPAHDGAAANADSITRGPGLFGGGS